MLWWTYIHHISLSPLPTGNLTKLTVKDFQKYNYKGKGEKSEGMAVGKECQ